MVLHQQIKLDQFFESLNVFKHEKLNSTQFILCICSYIVSQVISLPFTKPDLKAKNVLQFFCVNPGILKTISSSEWLLKSSTKCLLKEQQGWSNDFQKVKFFITQAEIWFTLVNVNQIFCLGDKEKTMQLCYFNSRNQEKSSFQAFSYFCFSLINT